MVNLRKAAEMALEALETLLAENNVANREYAAKASQALRQALAQPEQRPVGTYEGVMETMLSLRKGTLEQQQIYTHMKDKLLYTAPPKREWVGLTKDEIEEIADWSDKNAAPWYLEYARAIEAKLKEKNGVL